MGSHVIRGLITAGETGSINNHHYTTKLHTAAPVITGQWQYCQVQIPSSYCFWLPLWAAHPGKETEDHTRRWLMVWKAQAGAGAEGPGHPLPPHPHSASLGYSLYTLR